jgi:hypothetical protein
VGCRALYFKCNDKALDPEVTLVRSLEPDAASAASVEALEAEVGRLRQILRDVTGRLLSLERRLAALENPAAGTQTVPVADLNASNDE